MKSLCLYLWSFKFKTRKEATELFSGIEPRAQLNHLTDKMYQAPVVHTRNPSYSGHRDQEDRGSKPAQANSSVRPYLEKTFYKKELAE
jgi:hypothetical protein